jgi:hypothetical protein
MEEQNMNNQNPSHMENMSNDNMMPEEDKKQTGSLIGIIIIILIIVIGGFYFWGQKLDEVSIEPTAEEILAEEDVLSEALETQGTSDELTDIEADLESTNLDDLDAELSDIDLELTI